MNSQALGKHRSRFSVSLWPNHWGDDGSNYILKTSHPSLSMSASAAPPAFDIYIVINIHISTRKIKMLIHIYSTQIPHTKMYTQHFFVVPFRQFSTPCIHFVIVTHTSAKIIHLWNLLCSVLTRPGRRKTWSRLNEGIRSDSHWRVGNVPEIL